MRGLWQTVCLAVLVTASGCSEKAEKAPLEIVRPVLSVVVTPRTSQTLGFAGTIEPEISANLAFRLLGRVVARDVGVGDTVTKGKTVAALDPTALELGVQAAKAELSNAEAQFANAAASEERQRQLLAAGNTSQAVYDTAQQGRQSAQANVERAKAALAKTEEQLGYARLFSDFDGVVTATGAEVGQTVAAGQTIVTVARADKREAVVDVSDQFAGGLVAGTPFDVTLQSLPSIRAVGTVREVAPQADSPTRSRRVRLALVDPPRDFRLGSTITATRVEKIAPSIDLPLTALLDQEGKTSVWVVDPQASTVSQRQISVGAKADSSFTVSKGLEDGQRVVTAGVHSLTEGQKVKIIEGAAP